MYRNIFADRTTELVNSKPPALGLKIHFASGQVFCSRRVARPSTQPLKCHLQATKKYLSPAASLEGSQRHPQPPAGSGELPIKATKQFKQFKQTFYTASLGRLGRARPSTTPPNSATKPSVLEVGFRLLFCRAAQGPPSYRVLASHFFLVRPRGVPLPDSSLIPLSDWLLATFFAARVD